MYPENSELAAKNLGATMVALNSTVCDGHTDCAMACLADTLVKIGEVDDTSRKPAAAEPFPAWAIVLLAALGCVACGGLVLYARRRLRRAKGYEEVDEPNA